MYMSTAVIGWTSLGILIATIILGVKKNVNLGILAIGVSFLLGFFVYVEGGVMSAPALKGKPITSLFPFDIFWMTVSVSLMLNVGTVNGTFDIIIKRLVNLAHGRRALIPVYIFFIVFLACSVGAGTIGVVVLLCTLTSTIAKDQDIDPVFMLLSAICGSTIGVGSPVAVIGIVCNSFSKQLWGEPIAPSYMYPRSAMMAVLTFAAVYILFKGWKLERWPQTEKAAVSKLNREQILTLMGLAVFILLAIVLKFDMGLSAFLIAAILLLFGCADEKRVIAEVPWSSILLISGMCMFIGIIQIAGGMDLLTKALSGLMNRYTVKPLYSVIGSLLAMVSSATGVVLPSMIPTIPEIAAQTGVNPYALVTALAYGANITCASPLGSMGAIALGIMSTNPQWDSSALFKKMLLYVVILTGISALWAALGVAG